MGKTLVVVESPAKARTIERFLSGGQKVLASMGHVRDLPESTLGVQIDDTFTPQYRLTQNGKRVVGDLRTAAAAATEIYLATDPDREGEAIAWHLQEILSDKTSGPFRRVAFHEITRSAVAAAIAAAGTIDMRKVEAQQARRILDRLVGYQVSPLLWKRIGKGTSAGRVQSVALRLVCEREREIDGFVPVEYWHLDAVLHPVGTAVQFTARLIQVDARKAKVEDAETAAELAAELERAAYAVSDVRKTPRKKAPPPPFITSTLQQAAGGLRFSTRQTMRIAQQLYEGIDLGREGAGGLITYMRTDSVTVAKDAVAQVRELIRDRFGAEFLPASPNVYRSRKSAQEAHEAIRPTDARRRPESVRSHLNPAQFKLYRLIWSRFVASQMTPARFLEHAIEVEAGGPDLSHRYLLRATAREQTFPGFQAVYSATADSEADNGDEPTVALPELDPGTACDLVELLREQCFTEPPRRYSEAALVRELERNGIGRPSTYATIVNTIQTRKYVGKQSKGQLAPTPLGFRVNDYLVERLPELLDTGFTAKMETQLDRIEEGTLEWNDMLKEFYSSFEQWIREGPAVPTPNAAGLEAIFYAFPADLQWAPPVKRGRRVYDDHKFFQSLREQFTEQKRLSDKQWLALLAMAARYHEQMPGLQQCAADLDVRPQLDKLIAAEETRAAETSATELPARLQGLIDMLAAVDWAPPEKRANRTYNDRRFYKSICSQAEADKKLSDAQVAALTRLALKYRNQIPDFENLAAALNIETPAPPSAEQQQTTTELLAMLDAVKEWQPPRKRGTRSFDDKEFAASVKQQYARRGQLSDKQLRAVRKLLGRYAAQLPSYAEQAALLQLPPTADTASANAPACPNCGAPLLHRRGRGRSFFGCSAFPKCRYTRRETESGQEGAGEAAAADET